MTKGHSKTQRPKADAVKGRTARSSARRLVTNSEEVTIVGVGASAGGLEAFSSMIRALPPAPGVAIVLVQHLAPQHESALPTLLAGYTSMPVVQVTEGMRVEVDHLFVIPPNVQMALADGHFHLKPRPEDRSQYTPIDAFLTSLAEHAQRRAVGVILSGTASDGAMGIREVKAAGGITFAQKPDTAKYDSMPRAAIATGMVDMVLSPPDIAAKLPQIAAHPYVRELVVRSGDELSVSDDHTGHWYSLRIRPYKSVDNKIDGAVLTLFDIDVPKRSEQRLRLAKEYVDTLLEVVDQPIAVLDAGLCVLVANDRFARALGKPPDAIVGMHVSDLDDAWKLAALLQDRIQASSGTRSGFERTPIEVNEDGGPRRVMWLSGRWLPWHESPDTQVLLLSISPSDAAAVSGAL